MVSASKLAVFVESLKQRETTELLSLWLRHDGNHLPLYALVANDSEDGYSDELARMRAATLALQVEINRRIPPQQSAAPAQLLTPIEAALLGGYVGEALDDLAASALPESEQILSRATAAKALAAIARVTQRTP